MTRMLCRTRPGEGGAAQKKHGGLAAFPHRQPEAEPLPPAPFHPNLLNNILRFTSRTLLMPFSDTVFQRLRSHKPDAASCTVFFSSASLPLSDMSNICSDFACAFCQFLV